MFFIALAIFAVALSSTPVQTANILHISAVNASSHHDWNYAIATALAERGHKLTFIGVRQVENTHPNIEYHFYEQSKEANFHWNAVLDLTRTGTTMEQIWAHADTGVVECDNFFKYPPFKNLIDPNFNRSYDLVLFEYGFYDCLFPLSVVFNAPIIIVNPLTAATHFLYRIMGVPHFHAYSHVADDKKIAPLSFLERVETLAIYLLDDYHYYKNVRPEMEKINRKYFGPDIPPIKNLTERIALGLVNLADWMNKVPLPPNVIPVGGLHLKEAKPLETDLQTFLDEAKHGAILISFGTIFTNGDVQLETLQNIISALSKVPQRILWKWDDKLDVRNLSFSLNVRLSPWIPQNDVLSHPNLRLFISHCGGQSSLETTYHGVPVLAIPAFWDQRENANRFVAEKMGIRLDFKDITEANFFQAIMELTENPRYLQSAKKLQKIFRDQATTPLDRAMYWIEFVIRHRGAPHLRPFLWDLPNPLTLIFDMILISVLGVLVSILGLASLYFLGCFFKWSFVPRLLAKNKTE